jgi:hypothetical protein
MIRKATMTPLRTCVLSGAALMAAFGVALLPGCKGNSTSAAVMEHRPGKPPVVIANRAAPNIQTADPLTNPSWRTVMLALAPPANTTRTTALTQAGVLFDDQTLYVAFICEKQPTTAAQSRDAVSLYLDPLGNGLELFQVTVDSTGTSACAWLRSSEPAEPLDDGSPDFGHPVVAVPNLTVSGLAVRVREATDEGHPVWTCQITLPLAGLPPKLQVKPAPTTHWRFNLVRTFATLKGGKLGEQFQSNLSPFYVNAQAVSPYRLADLQFPDDKATPTNKLATTEHP